LVGDDFELTDLAEGSGFRFEMSKFSAVSSDSARAGSMRRASAELAVGKRLI
jgi:hypothetical protein